MKITGRILLSLLTVFFMASCHPEGDNESNGILFSPEVVQIVGTGGDAMVEYCIADRTDVQEFEFSCEADWVTGFKVPEPGYISFFVKGNPTDAPRRAEVKVSSSLMGIEGVFSVVQDVGDVGELRILVSGKTSNSFSFSIVPEDPEMPYVYRFAELSVFEGYGSDEGCIQYCIDYYMGAAEYYGQSLDEFLSEEVTYGERPDTTIIPVRPETVYVLFAFGLSTDGEPLTDLYKVYIDTYPAEMIDMDFTLDVSVEGKDVDLNVTPSDDAQAYFFDMCFAEDAGYGDDSDVLVSFIQSYINEIITTYRFYYGYTYEEVIDMISSYGPDSYSTSLQYGNSYIAYAAAIDGTGLVISDAAFTMFSTESVESDNEISVTLSNLTPESVDYTVTTANDEDYVLTYDTAEWWAGLTDEQIMEYLILGYDLSMFIHSGDLSGTFSGLNPGTDYFVIAFGYDSGYSTTDPVVVRFTTPESGASQAASGVRFPL